MKYFFSILAFAILYMSCIPCGDSQECNVKTEAKITASKDHQQHNHESEACTPFCTCSCCAISANFSPLFKTLTTKVVPLSEKYLLFNVAIIAEAHYSIWQPPKLLA